MAQRLIKNLGAQKLGSAPRRPYCGAAAALGDPFDIMDFRIEKTKTWHDHLLFLLGVFLEFEPTFEEQLEVCCPGSTSNVIVLADILSSAIAKNASNPQHKASSMAFHLQPASSRSWLTHW